MVYSRNDIYPSSSATLTSVEQTIETEDSMVAADVAVNPVSNTKTHVDKKMIWGAMLLFIGVMVLLHFFGGE